MSDRFILIAFLILIDVILNKLTHIRLIMFMNYKIESTNNVIVISHRDVVMCCCNKYLHYFKYVNLILMIENVIFLIFTNN